MSLTGREGSPSLTTSHPMDASNHSVTTRKRRRRVPASGAADDCFACRRRNMKCDRRRPYCTQCLEQGKECSGYKTQLTWGVGVASRGKLRGQTLPVLKKTKSPPALSSQRARRSFSSAAESTVLSRASSQAPAEDPHNSSPDITTSPALVPGYDHFSFVSSPSADASIQHSPNVCHRPLASRWMEDQSQTLYAHRRPLEALLHLHTPLATSFEDYGQPGSASSISTFSESEITSAPHLPRTLDDASCLFPPVSVYDLLAHQPGMTVGPPCVQVDQRAPTSYPEQYISCMDGGLSSSVSSITSSNLDSIDGFFELDGCHKLPPSPLDPCNLSDVCFEDSTSGMTLPSADGMELGFGWEPHVEHVASNPQADDLPMRPTATELSLEMLSPARTLQLSSGCNTSYRMRYLVDYYDQVICSALVAPESTENPFRCQLLPLVQSSDSLLYAIGALSASSLRRREAMSSKSINGCTEIRLGLGGSSNHQISLDGGNVNQFNIGSVEPVFSGNSSCREELHLKELSVKHLNSRLRDPSQAIQDSVLATLLVLCLFHACRTGIASFDTQFTGIRKLLHLRRECTGAEKPCWMTVVFAYIDVMIATINDREPQLQEIWVDISENTENKANIEMLTGCEANLFNIIASLGHLNTLSKNRLASDGVRGYFPSRNPLNQGYFLSSSLFSAASASTSAPASALSSSLSTTSSRLAGQATRDYYSLNNIVPGNKGQSYIFSNEQANNTYNIAAPQSNFKVDEPDSDKAGKFSHEWKLTHRRLEEWKPSFNTSRSSDMSSSLRYAALLYTERLAAPAGLSSKYPRIQELVSQILSHISNVRRTSTTNDNNNNNNNNTIFTLWPLFIAGTECVDRAQRSFIRKHCRDMYKASGFINAMVFLRILKRLWRELDMDEVDEDEDYDFDDDDDDDDQGTTLHRSPASMSMLLKAKGASFKWRKYLDEVQGEYFVV